jgi:hypothetical protein
MIAMLKVALRAPLIRSAAGDIYDREEINRNLDQAEFVRNNLKKGDQPVFRRSSHSTQPL